MGGVSSAGGAWPETEDPETGTTVQGAGGSAEVRLKSANGTASGCRLG